MYDGLADSYNNYNYGTTRSSYYSKLQMGNGSWGYPVRAGGGGATPQKVALWPRRVAGRAAREEPPTLTGSLGVASVPWGSPRTPWVG